MYYLLNNSMKELNDDYLKKDGDILVSLVTTEECEHMHSQLPFYSILERNMRHHNIQSCKADLLKDCIIGTLRVPDHKFLQENSLSLTFYLSKDPLSRSCCGRENCSPHEISANFSACLSDK
mgnify:CR=1 FL=1